MSVSKFLLTLSAVSVMLLTACADSGTYPISGQSASFNDPVHDMVDMTTMFRGEAR